MIHEAAVISATSIMKCLGKGIEDEACMGSPTRPPAEDATSEDVDDISANAQHLSRGHVDEALPDGDIGEVRNP